MEFLLDNLDPAVERFELRGRGEQLSELLFIGVRLAPFIGVGKPLVLFEEITQVRLARLDPFAIRITESSVNEEFITSPSTSFWPASMRGNLDFLLPR